MYVCPGLWSTWQMIWARNTGDVQENSKCFHLHIWVVEYRGSENVTPHVSVLLVKQPAISLFLLWVLREKRNMHQIEGNSQQLAGSMFEAPPRLLKAIN